MTEKLQQTIQEEVIKLPKEAQEAINFLDWIKIAEEIGKKYLLNEEEINNFQLETLLVLIGVVDPEFYAINIENQVGTTKDSANKMADEAFEKIFKPIGEKIEENIKKHMADNTIDLLEIKIEKAKRELPLETVNAINAVDWKAVILGLREKKGYTFEQLGDLELETELALCGLTAPENYPRELENRMGISRGVADELTNEMNNLVFKKIREELIKNTERKKIFAKKTIETEDKENEREQGLPLLKIDTAILNTAG